MSTKKKTKKKVAAKPQQQMSPKNYILTGRVRKLPITECWISSDWKDNGLCTITVARQHATGNMTFGVYLLDTYCLGLKNTNSVFSKPRYEYEDICESLFSQHEGRIEIDYVLAHNIIYGAIAYAGDLGFKPQKDWVVSQMILEEDTEDIELIEVEFGKDGKPYFISGPYDNVSAITAKLNKAVGEGNYHFLMEIGGRGQESYDFEEDFEDDDDYEDDDNVEEAESKKVK